MRLSYSAVDRATFFLVSMYIFLYKEDFLRVIAFAEHSLVGNARSENNDMHTEYEQTANSEFRFVYGE